MDLRSFFKTQVSILRQKGLKAAALYGTQEIRNKVVRGIGMYDGDSVMTDDWDLLIILDACRLDALSEVAGEFDFLPTKIESKYSVASASDTWMERTFTDKYSKELSRTIYVNGNPNSEQHLPKELFQNVYDVYKTAYNPDLGTTPARPLTDCAIRHHREQDPERMIVHYMQPHFPSVPDPLGFGIVKGSTNPEDHEWIWADGRPADYTREELWDSYVKNLRYVLKDVSILLENVTSERAIITADHGNAFGEWGVWGHPHQPLRVLREVPWVATSGLDSGTHEPDEISVAGDQYSAAEQLKALGYR